MKLGCSDKVPSLRAIDLRCESCPEPLGVDTAQPRLSWVLPVSDAEVLSPLSLVRVQAATSAEALAGGRPDLWDSGDLSAAIPWADYAGAKLRSHQRVFWRIRCGGNDAPWSDPGSFVTGLMSPRDWRARWIGHRLTPPELHGTARETLPLFRKEFSLRGKPANAFISLSGLGHFALWINGQAVSDDFLVPGWTQYGKTALYLTYEVTSLLRPGDNAIGVMLGNGFFNINGDRYAKTHRSDGWPQMILRLDAQLNDDRPVSVTSDTTWKVGRSPITFSCIYGGEDYDARLHNPAWTMSGFDDAGWMSAILEVPPCLELRPQLNNASKVAHRYVPAKLQRSTSGALVADFGTNMAGIPKLTVIGQSGQTVELRPGELLDDTGCPDQRVSGQPHIYRYTLADEGGETWHPRFSYYGFRHIEIAGARTVDEAGDNPVLQKIEALELSACGQPAGQFRASDEMLMRIHELVLRAIRSNLQSVMTDCPHREKLGWISDLGYMGPSFMDNYDLGAFYRKVLDDIADTQQTNGRVFTTAPRYLLGPGWSIFGDSPEWGISYVLCPWLHYQRFGDERLLAKHYRGMKAYCDYLEMRSERGILSYGLSDWYDRGPGPTGFSQLTPDGVTATAVYFEGLQAMARVARVLDREKESAAFARRADRVAAAFRKKFFDPATGRVATGSQTAQAMTLVLGLAPGHEERLRARLLEDIEARGHQFTAGNIGHRYLLLALHEAGRSDLVYHIHRRTDAPSYAYQVAHGATTLTEAWDCYRGSSQNHSMLGHIEEWFYECLAGLRPAADCVGYDKLQVEPAFLNELTEVAASVETCRGRLSSHWRRNGDAIQWQLEIPNGSAALATLPVIKPGSLRVAATTGLIPCLSNGQTRSAKPQVLELNSGKYQIDFCLAEP